MYGFSPNISASNHQLLADLFSQTVVTLQSPHAVQQFLSQCQPSSSSQLDG